MQDLSHEDFSLLNGGASSGEKDSNCSYGLHVVGGSHFITTAAPVLPATGTTTSTYTASTANHLLAEPLGTYSTLHPRLRPTIHEHEVNLYEDNSPSLIAAIKLEEQSTRDLFPSHASTWHQHPLNNYEHHHTQHYQHHQHQHQHHQQQEQHHQNLHNQYRLMNVTSVSSKSLLQSSDDPLICRGANSVTDDDPPAEFNTLIAAAGTKEKAPQPHQILQQSTDQSFQQTSHQMSQSLRSQPHRISSVPEQQRQPSPSRTTNGCSSLTKQQLKIKASRMSHMNHCQQTQTRSSTAPGSPKARTIKTKKIPGTVKLRFHHQALPAEYLSHYEATQTTAVTKKDVAPSRPTAETPKLPPPKSANENVRSWLQKIAELHRTSQKSQQPCETQPTHDANNNQAEVASAMTETYPGNTAALMETKVVKSFTTPTHTKRVVNYSDLPYMGEITLDHSKPKRGRKPKKADICHLIYKNYGTILPGTPKNKLNKSLIETPRQIKGTEEEAGREEEDERKTDHCFKLENISSYEEEPLNLCLRDQSSEDLYSISSIEDDEEEGDNEEDDLNESSRGDTPLMTSADVANDSLLAANLKLAMPSLLLEDPTASLPGQHLSQRLEPPAPISSVHTIPTTATHQQSHLHPMSLYYQKLIESGTLVSSSGLSNLGFPVETIQRDNQLALKIPIPSGLFLTPKLEKSSTPAPPAGSPPDYPEPMSTPSSLRSENSVTTNASSAAVQQLQLPPQPTPKRKRSAIYIPPMPAENANNPSNEVSICKFKFTGGARPTLQEKKMLSVDAGGNYRYYSGTGDKSTRGYEFFPRESIQQSGGVLPGVNCASGGGGEKMTLDIPPPSLGLGNELLQIPDSPTGNMLLLTPSVPTITTDSPRVGGATAPLLSVPVSVSLDVSPNPRACSSTSSSNDLPNQQQQKHHFAERKKKSRRSAQREKLEKTFKEKGFLIQTQQLESAEGATYCKFRQLKKFTRYLFRNWKDYLPDELQQANEAAAACAAAAALNQHQFHHHQQQHQQPTLTTKPAESISVTSSQPTDPIMENLLASHGFGGAQRLSPCMLQERLVEDSRMTVEPSLD